MLLRVYYMTKPVTSLTALLREQQGMINPGGHEEKLVPELCSVKVLKHPEGSLKDFVPLENGPTRHNPGSRQSRQDVELVAVTVSRKKRWG